jgi:DNA-directed RNA polymerase subunit RPC12/RpoP
MNLRELLCLALGHRWDTTDGRRDARCQRCGATSSAKPTELRIKCPACNGDAAVFLCHEAPFTRIGHAAPACTTMLTSPAALGRRFLGQLSEEQGLTLERHQYRATIGSR